MTNLDEIKSPPPAIAKPRGSMFRAPNGGSYAVTFALVCSLFLLSALCNSMIDVLNKHFQNSLGVSKAQSTFVQGVWYAAYFFMALPSGWVARKFGYKTGILTGLLVVIAGCLLFVPVTRLQASEAVIFAAFLGALFVLGSGLTFLETIANPYATVLGPAESGVARINLGQSCNAVGWIIGPILASSFVLSKTGHANTSNAALFMPYLIVAGMVTLMVIIFSFGPVPEIHARDEAQPAAGGAKTGRPLHHEKHFLLGIVSQFLYCAGQIGIFSFFINYLKDDHYVPALPGWLAGLLPDAMKFTHADGGLHLTEYGAGVFLSIAFGLFTVGRFSGSAIVRYCSPHRTLGIYALVNVVLMLVVMASLGWISVVALMLSFFFMSIMYPTHFALSIRGLGEKTKLAAAWMVTAVVGGAILPYFMGRLADNYSMRVGFVMPLLCFCFIAFYGFSWRSWFAHDMEPEEKNSPTIIH
jgi:FHS family L-fucose permease-like MFS transporter